MKTFSTLLASVSLLASCAGAPAYAGLRSGIDDTIDTTLIDPAPALYPHFICASGCGAVTQSGAWSVGVSNFPATQTVNGTVSVPGMATSANQPALNADGGGLAHVTNWPASQAVSGSVSVGNLPAIQAVSGTISVGNFPLTQAMSAASLPLPSGAATSANQNPAEHSDLAQLHADYTSPTPPQTSTGVDIGATENAAIGTTVASTALGSSLVIKATPAKLSSAYVDSTVAGKLVLIDATTAPPSGAAILPKECVDAPANVATWIGFSGLPPESYTTGITALFTTGGCFLYTPSATAFFHGVWQ